MTQLLMTLVSSARAKVMKVLLPAQDYSRIQRGLEPISIKYGYDRGEPIDRYYIEAFLQEQQAYIHGKCLEITDASYLKRFGGKRVTDFDVLDIKQNNKRATIYGDLRQLTQIKTNTYDCIVLTHVLGLIDAIDCAIAEVYRILKPGGTVLFTGSCLGPSYDGEEPYWRFTLPGALYLFGKVFEPSKMMVKAYGNVLAGQAFWVGLSQSDVTKIELDYFDRRFPCIIALRATK